MKNFKVEWVDEPFGGKYPRSGIVVGFHEGLAIILKEDKTFTLKSIADIKFIEFII